MLRAWPWFPATSMPTTFYLQHGGDRRPVPSDHGPSSRKGAPFASPSAIVRPLSREGARAESRLGAGGAAKPARALRRSRFVDTGRVSARRTAAEAALHVGTDDPGSPEGRPDVVMLKATGWIHTPEHELSGGRAGRAAGPCVSLAVGGQHGACTGRDVRAGDGSLIDAALRTDVPAIRAHGRAFAAPAAQANTAREFNTFRRSPTRRPSRPRTFRAASAC